MIKIGMIGGSGFDDPDFLSDTRRVKVHSPYGPLSGDPVIGNAQGVEVALISRHGSGHRLRPTDVNFRANIWAMKELGVTHLIATTACGSLREEIKPGHLVFPDQFIDRTTKREASFYTGDQVAHIAMADPFCEKLRQTLISAAEELDVVHHTRGTVVTIEGPRFSTRAESRMFRLWGGDIINMSTAAEAVLAREAGICYATVAMSTDYDAWHESEAPVTWEMIVETMNKNVENVKRIFFNSLHKIDFEDCECVAAIKTALV